MPTPPSASYRDRERPWLWSRGGVGVLLLLLPLAGALGLLPASLTQGQTAAVTPTVAAVAAAPTLAAAAPTVAAAAPTAVAVVAPTVAAAATAAGAGAAGVAAAVPAIALPSGFRITTPTFPLSGTAAPNSKVEVMVDGQPVGTATAGPDGKWSLPSITLPSGAKELSVRTVDATGKETGKSAPIALSSLGFGAAAGAQATTAPGAASAQATAAPGATGAAGAAGAQATTAPGAAGAAAGSVGVIAIAFPSGFRITSPTFPVSGTAAPNSKVEVMVDGQVVGTTTAGPDGKWTVTAITLPANAKEIVARQVDAAGKETGKSAPIALSSLGFSAAAGAQATTAPGAASAQATTAPGATGAAGAAGAQATTAPGATGAAGAVVGSVGVIAIAFPSGFRITSPTFPVSGTAAPNSKVEVMVDGQVVGTTTAGPDGKWTVTAITLPANAKEIVARQVDAAGKETGKSAPIALSSLGFGAAAGAQATTAPGAAGAAAAQATTAPGATGAAGAAAAQATTAPGATGAAAGSVGVIAIAFPSGFRITSPTFPVSGTAAPNSKVEVMIDGQVVGTTTAGPDGKWTVTAITLPANAKEIVARQVDAAGKETGKTAPIALSSLGFTAAMAGTGTPVVPSALPHTGGDGSLVGLVVLVGLLTLGLGLLLRRRSTNAA